MFDNEGGANPKTSLTGVEVGVDVTSQQKIWRSFQALGNIAFAYAYSQVLIDIQASIILYGLLLVILFFFFPFNIWFLMQDSNNCVYNPFVLILIFCRTL